MSTETKKRRRRSERNAADYDDDTLEFIQAIDTYRRRFDRSFPAWSEVLTVVKALGYRKIAEPIPLEKAVLTATEIVEPTEPVEPTEDDF